MCSMCVFLRMVIFETYRVETLASWKARKNRRPHWGLIVSERQARPLKRYQANPPPPKGHRRARPWPKPLTRDPHSQARPVQHHHSQPILLAIVSPLGPCRDSKPKHKFIARSKKTLKCPPKTGRGQTTKNHQRTADKPLLTTSEPRTNHWPTRMPRDTARPHLDSEQ